MILLNGSYGTVWDWSLKRGMQSLIGHNITHPEILIRSCVGITLILLHIQNIPLSGMAVAYLHHSHSSN